MNSFQPFAPYFKFPNSTSSNNETVAEKPDESIGFLDVFVHQARDIHNICIYHKQDVYAKLSLTTDPQSSSKSTQIINGGGRNPVFNQNLRLSVKTIDSSLKCEIWMLSRVKNYLEDQLLGFAVMPLADVVVANGKVDQEFSLSSTDLFHSPAGFVKLSILYTGSLPEVVSIATPLKSMTIQDNHEDCPCEYNKIEFLDLNIANENRMMVSECFGIPCTNLDSQNADSDNCPDNDEGVRLVESFTTTQNGLEHVQVLENDTILSNGSTDGSPNLKDRDTDGETDSSVETTNNSVKPPLINVHSEQEHSVVEQDIVDMYMRSMQQFTDSLANMKLPLDIEHSSSSSGSSVNTANGNSALKKTGTKVFYGSRAFF